MSKIMFCDVIYGTPRGHSYVNRDLIRILKNEGHEVILCKSFNNAITKEFDLPDKIYDNKNKQSLEMGKGQFLDIIETEKPDFCFFNEYGQWNPITYDKLDVCKEKGIKTVGYLIWEKLDFKKQLKHYKKYDVIIAPTGFQTKYMRKNGLYSVKHIPWGVFKEEFDAVEQPQNKKDKTIFLHVAGAGGVDGRKNTGKVIKAFEAIKDDSCELVITDIRAKAFSREDIIKIKKHADVIVNTSKWDTIGLDTCESNMCSKPVLVCDADPMNELVKDNINGFTVKCDMTTSDAVTCPVADVDVEDLSAKMNMLKNKLILETLKNNSRIFAETNFDWMKNKIHFLKIFEEK
jgi:glycosyltransferase involved in cell wall biosynthesis